MNLGNDEEVKELYGVLTRFFVGRVRRGEDVDDLIQETLLRVLQFLSTGKTLHKKPVAYVLGVAGNIKFEHYRAAVKKSSHCSPESIGEDEHFTLHEDPESMLLEEERMDAYHYAMKTLRPDEEAFILKKFVTSSNEIARETGTTREVVDMRSYRLKKKLIKGIKVYYEGGKHETLRKA